MRDDESRLLDILLASRAARGFVAGLSHDEFVGDDRTQSAVCLKLEIIGEAARTITQRFKDAHPEIPWARIVGLRHRIVHEYFRLDLDVIWDILHRDLPALVAQVGPLVPPDNERTP